MTVASIPMWSAVARSMPADSPVAPRQMLPPPTTTAISTPRSRLALGDLGGDAGDGRAVDGLVDLGGGERLARHLEDDPPPAGLGRRVRVGQLSRR